MTSISIRRYHNISASPWSKLTTNKNSLWLNHIHSWGYSTWLLNMYMLCRIIQKPHSCAKTLAANQVKVYFIATLPVLSFIMNRFVLLTLSSYTTALHCFSSQLMWLYPQNIVFYGLHVILEIDVWSLYICMHAKSVLLLWTTHIKN